MSTEAEQVPVAAGGGPEPLEPVPPAALVRVVMGPMTKILNPVFRRLAGRKSFGMAAQVHHIGRRSGRRYVTPVGARRRGETIVIPLTFGNRSDWAQNVRAAGGCSIRLRGVEYVATQPRFLALADAQPLVRSAFPPLMRASFRLLGIRQVLSLQARSAG